MRPWTNNHTQDHPPKDPDILRWFEALGPPPTGQPPSDLRVKVLARIAQRRAWSGMLAWVPRLATPAWVTVFAAVLVLSLSLNVWWSIRSLSPRPQGTRDAADSLFADFGPAERLRTYRFQGEMQRANELGTFIAAHSSLRPPSAVVGFTPQASRRTFLRMGILYAEALAALSSGAVEAASQRLDILEEALASVQAPRVLSQYLREMRSLLQTQRYEGTAFSAFLALFEPLYEDAYASTDITEGWLLFRVGAWLENMYLAAATGDSAALQRGGQVVEDVSRVLMRLNAPREVLEALERMRSLFGRQVLSDSDMSTIRKLVQDIQRILSE